MLSKIYSRKRISLISIGTSFLFVTALVALLHKDKEKKISIIHTVSYSNAVVFRTITSNPGIITGNFIPEPSKHIEALVALSKNGPTVAVTPFANALIGVSANKDLRIIAGSGLNGISLVGVTVSKPSDLINKKVGTSKGDSLEIFAIEYLRKVGLSPSSYSLIYFTDPFVAVEAAKRRSIDALTHVEPFATNLIEDNSMRRIVTSRELWGDHPDAVLITTTQSLTKYKPQLRWLIYRLLEQERLMNSNPVLTAKELSSFYQMPPNKLERILEYQKPSVRIDQYVDFLKDRYSTLEQLKYVHGPFPKYIFDFSLFPGK
jgi:ABC-type nitrate/sulfonate/bicarbonate transport system substrate-binding protein